MRGDALADTQADTLAATLAGAAGRWSRHPRPAVGTRRGRLPCLQALDGNEQARLRDLCAAFLARKEFSGAHGLVVDDRMALLVAAQACLPLRHRGLSALAWYDDFVGIVLHPDEVVV